MLFGTKDIYAKITKLAEAGKLGKLERIAVSDEQELVRAAAYRAMGKLRAKETIDVLFNAMRSDETVKVKMACAQSLEKIASRAEFDAINHFADDATDEELKKALQAAAVSAKERTPRW